MTFDSKRLQDRWYHSHEEDSSHRQVFRPESYTLPPARGRSVYEFRSDGSVLIMMPGPDDKPSSEQGTWTLDENGRITIHVQGRSDEVLQIEKLESDRLVVKK